MNATAPIAAIRLTYSRKERRYVTDIRFPESICPAKNTYFVSTDADGLARALRMMDADTFGPKVPAARFMLREAIASIIAA